MNNSQANYNKSIITIGKDILASLPAAGYTGEIKVIDKPEQVMSAVEEIRTADIIGFDTETRPSFKKGQSFKVALVQLATPDCVYLFRTNLIGIPDELISIFEDKKIKKIGVSLHDDFLNLRKIKEFEPISFIDLQTYAKEFKIADNGLSRIYGILFGERISKNQRLTNWEAPTLTESQKIYAALDAYACIKIFEYLSQGKFIPRKSPYLTLPPDPTLPQTEC